jgi:hypothetical protein
MHRVRASRAAPLGGAQEGLALAGGEVFAGAVGGVEAHGGRRRGAGRRTPRSCGAVLVVAVPLPARQGSAQIGGRLQIGMADNQWPTSHRNARPTMPRNTQPGGAVGSFVGM